MFVLLKLIIVLFSKHLYFNNIYYFEPFPQVSYFPDIDYYFFNRRKYILGYFLWPALSKPDKKNTFVLCTVSLFCFDVFVFSGHYFVCYVRMQVSHDRSDQRVGISNSPNRHYSPAPDPPFCHACIEEYNTWTIFCWGNV